MRLILLLLISESFGKGNLMHVSYLNRHKKNAGVLFRIYIKTIRMWRWYKEIAGRHLFANVFQEPYIFDGFS